jgi:16S rRNA processing protein RimM
MSKRRAPSEKAESSDSAAVTNQELTGSPLSSEPAFLVAGKLRRSHGLYGEMMMDIITDFPERMVKGREVYVGESHLPLRIRSSRGNNASLLVSFEGYETPESVADFRNALLYVRTDSLPPLPEGEYYQFQLLGLQVVDEQGALVGTLKEILPTGANDVYIVQPAEGKEVLLPAVPDFILSVELSKRTMRVKLPQWW